MRCQNCLSMLYYSTSGNRLFSKMFAPLDEIEKYDLWCKTRLMDVMRK
jgi:hypothetical protein